MRMHQLFYAAMLIKPKVVKKFSLVLFANIDTTIFQNYFKHAMPIANRKSWILQIINHEKKSGIMSRESQVAMSQFITQLIGNNMNWNYCSV